MNEVGKQRRWSIPLQVQTDLEHRGGLGSGDTSLFPPAGTFETVGGRESVAKIVDGLYDRIETDTLLRPAFNRDLTEERKKLKLFFEGWFGGVPTYFNKEWPPGLKAAHGSISISRGMAGRWVGHFLDACADAVKDPVIVKRIKPIISRLAMALVNRQDEPVPGERLRGSAYCADPRLLHPVQRDDAAGISATACASPEVIPRHGSRLLLIAALRGKAVAAEELLRQGVDANAVALLPGGEASAHGLPMLPVTPLCGALAKRRDTVAKLLVEHGAQYDIFTASCIGDLDAVRKLLDLAPELADARDPACDVAQITPLMHAISSGQLEVARLLLQRGAKVGANSARLVRPAANRGDEVLTDLLLEHGADPAQIGAGAWVMYPAIADKLLARGATVNHEPGAWVGLCCTGNSGHKENVALVRAMLRCGADVTAQYKGRTALHCAAKAGFVNVVEALIEHGGDVNALNDRGQTPLDEVENAARSIDREPVRRLLIAHRARRSKHEATEREHNN
ncbi:MAG: ankyrin repeat domain-containing protein [Candidatus Latescibacteria bacterium]|nr:ankyrin repeat domain-containing protein [Candidatus Latescibacterota bacterium]